MLNGYSSDQCHFDIIISRIPELVRPTGKIGITTFLNDALAFYQI